MLGYRIRKAQWLCKGVPFPGHSGGGDDAVMRSAFWDLDSRGLELVRGSENTSRNSLRC